MHPQTIFTKTAKGVLEVKNKTIRLPGELGLVFLAVDGKSSVAELPQRARLDNEALATALEKLVSDGYIKVFYQPPESGATVANVELDLDLDFTSPAKVAQLNSEAQRKVRGGSEGTGRNSSPCGRGSQSTSGI